MKRKVTYFLILMILIGALAACGNSEHDTAETEQAEKQDNLQEETEESEIEEQVDEGADSVQSEENDLEIIVEDQEGLGIGDTGIFDTVVGDFELTLNKAELVGKELDGEPSRIDDLIRLELTLKNIDNATILAEEVMSNMEVTHRLEGQGTVNYAEYFESARLFEGVIEPGEELTADFITDVYTAETYYLRRDSGNVAAGYSNQVIWTIPAEEAKQE